MRSREYALRYPGRRNLHANVFRRLEQRLCETGSVGPTAHVTSGRCRIVRTPANEEAIFVDVNRQPWGSSSDVAQELGLYQQRILDFLHDN
jgi:hypothetical protein